MVLKSDQISFLLPTVHSLPTVLSRGTPWIFGRTLGLPTPPLLSILSQPPSDAYDIVLSGQVIEHVRKIWLWIKELARVCKVGGLVITINPVSWPYHEHPIDCWRAFPEGMQALYEDASLEVLLSIFESLEATQYRRHIPGRSSEWQPRLLRNAYRILGRIGFPVECAYDTITIGKKVCTA